MGGVTPIAGLAGEAVLVGVATVTVGFLEEGICILLVIYFIILKREHSQDKWTTLVRGLENLLNRVWCNEFEFWKCRREEAKRKHS